MAAISSAHGGPTALTPPSSSHGDGMMSWELSQDQSLTKTNEKNGTRNPIHSHNGNSFAARPNSRQDTGARKMHSVDNLYSSWDSIGEDTVLSPTFPAENKTGRSDWSNMHTKSSDDLKRQIHSRAESRAEEDKWIHRDKLAKIESEELQAAGIYIPRARAQSKQRRERLTRQDTDTSEHSQVPKNDVSAVEEQEEHSVWDLRTPEEIAAEEASAYFVSDQANAGTRIPVAKTSRVPIPQDYLARGTTALREASESPEQDASVPLKNPKNRSRSASASVRDAPTTPGRNGQRAVTESSPKKGVRKTSSSSKASTVPAGRPKTRSGAKDSAAATGRPQTRSGDSVSSTKAPEGDPPWIFNSYKPDPRLPPDQQIIPTVARRLAQEKWEKEGKFGDVYDKEFRPLNDNHQLEHVKNETPSEEPTQVEDQAESSEWPLKTDPTEPAKSPTTRLGSSYSTMPKISDKAPVSPMPSPRAPMTSSAGNQEEAVPKTKEKKQPAPALPDDDDDKKGGCGCCVVM